MKLFELPGKAAIITGAGRGIGKATAELFAAAGAAVAVIDVSGEHAQRTAEAVGSMGGTAIPIVCDVTGEKAVEAAFAQAADELGGIDILVNNAGITADTLLLRMSLDQWESVLRTNLTGAFAMTKELVRGMMKRRFGRVISVSSVVGLMGNPGQANYAAAKAGLIGFSKSLARELGSRGITVNVVAPGYIETAMTAALPEAARKGLSEAIALQRLGDVDDIAAAVVYLASNEASYVTGHVLNVSGGMYM